VFVHIIGFGKFFYRKICMGLEKKSNKEVIPIIGSVI